MHHGLPVAPKRDAGGAITDINVTPLVDVCLVLVIIFMVLTPFAMQAGIEVASSRLGAAKGETAVKQNVTIVIDEKGRVKVNGRETKVEELGPFLKLALASSRDGLVSVNASPQVEVGRVVEVLDVSKQNGAKRVALLNQ